MSVTPRPGSGYSNRGRGEGPGRYRGGGGRNGPRNRGSRGPVENRDLSHAPQSLNGEPSYAPESGEYYSGPSRRPRPLTRVLARTRTNSANVNANPEDNFDNAYVMEVNEHVLRSVTPPATVPCVTVKDMRIFLPDKRQRRAYIPVAMAEELCKCLRQCRQDIDKGPYDLSKLPSKTFQCPVTKKKVEIEHVTEPSGKVSTRIRSYMDVAEKGQGKEDDIIEIFELRSELTGHLVKFLEDVATRYRHLEAEMNIPSLYSYSGERRFFYDLRETRWGIRLHISQVTDLYRNAIDIPLESVTAFRDRMNQVINFLGLEKKGSSPSANKSNEDNVNGPNSVTNRQRTISSGSGRRGGGRRGGRGRGRRNPGRYENGKPKGENVASENPATDSNEQADAPAAAAPNSSS
jgi:hypothetical protein